MTNVIRRVARWAAQALAPRAASARRSLPEPAFAGCRHPDPTPLPPHRSPYGLDVPLSGEATALVRPYVPAQEQRERRLALVLAADFGIDLDAHLIGAPGAAR